MSTAKLLPLRLAAKLADRLRAELAPHCERIEVAGSIRRRKSFVGDLELVAVPKVELVGTVGLFGDVIDPRERSLLDAHLDDMLAAPAGPIFRSRTDLFRTVGLPPDGLPDVQRWGERYKRFYFLWGSAGAIVPVDLFIASADNFGALFAIRTGPSDFSRELVAHLKRATPYRQQDGAVIVETSGEPVPVPDEVDYFALAGVPYIEPWHRSALVLRRAIREAGA